MEMSSSIPRCTYNMIVLSIIPKGVFAIETILSEIATDCGITQLQVLRSLFTQNLVMKRTL